MWNKMKNYRAVYLQYRPRHPGLQVSHLYIRKNQHSEEYLRMKRIFRENDFSVYTDPETGEIVCKVIPKDMDAERKKAERAAQLTALADLMDSNGYTIDELKELISTPKPTVEVADEE